MSEITQADREAAAAFIDAHGWLCEEEWRDVLPGDQNVIARAFARHRLQARTQALEEAAKVVLKKQMLSQDQRDLTGYAPANQAIRFAALCIRNLITQQTSTTPVPGSKGDD